VSYGKERERKTKRKAVRETSYAANRKEGGRE